MTTGVKEQYGGGGDIHDAHQVGEGVFHVNDREGRVNALGEELSGSQILNRVGLSSDRYELFTVKGGQADRLIRPSEIVPVKPGEHFRATLRGTDYSAPVGGNRS